MGIVLTTAVVTSVAVALVGIVMVALVIAAAFAVRMRGRRASRLGGGYAGGRGVGRGRAHRSPTSSGMQNRWHHLMGDLEAGSNAERDSSLRTNAERSAPPGAAAPDSRDRVDAEATHFFARPPADAAPATPFAGPVQNPAPAGASGAGLEPDSAAWAPAQTQFFGADELDDDQAVADHSADELTGGLLALPPAAEPGGRAAGQALERVRERLSAESTPQVVALSVIDSTGCVLAGATDDDVAGEMRSLMAESGQGHTTDLVQEIRFADDSRGAMLLLPTGTDALLGALVRDTDDLQATRARLRGMAHEIGDAIRAAS